MIIAQRTIDAIYQLSIEQVILKYCELKKSGASLKGCCPFHDEKTPSFVVTPAKGIYKCFGCGKGGNNPVSFVMEKESMSWIEAIRHLASAFNIMIDYEESEAAEKYKVRIERDTLLSKGNIFALDYFIEHFKDAPEKALRCKKETAELCLLTKSG